MKYTQAVESPTVTALLGDVRGEIALVSVQNPLAIDDYSEPDVALLKARHDNYRESHPTSSDVLLLIEVSDSTIITDRRDKIPFYAEVYAKAAVPVLWIVDLDLQNGAVEVYSNPSDAQYGKFERMERGRKLEVPGVPGATLSVDDIFG